MGRERKTGEAYIYICSRVEATRFERNRAFRVSVYCYYSPEIYRIYVQKEPMEPNTLPSPPFPLSFSVSLSRSSVFPGKRIIPVTSDGVTKRNLESSFFELWYVFAHQWTVYLLRKRKCAIPELWPICFAFNSCFFSFFFFFVGRFLRNFFVANRIFSSRREWSKRTNERWTRRFFTKIFIRATKEMGKACFTFFQIS